MSNNMADFTNQGEINTATHDSWRLFRIISEFVEGFETLSTIGPSVSIFGSARLKPTSPHYQIGVDVAYKIAKKGFSIITGAGLSLMEAANKGAQKAGGRSCGLVIDLPFEAEPNAFIDPKLELRFRYFFVRKVMFVSYAHGFVFLPGGYGTLDEMFETLTLIQTKKIQRVPIYFVGTHFWKGLIHWITSTLLAEKVIDKSDLELFILTDDLDEVASGLEMAYRDRIKLKEPEI
jgi:uncharacterized protein (TIGR00730 family)